MHHEANKHGQSTPGHASRRAIDVGLPGHTQRTECSNRMEARSSFSVLTTRSLVAQGRHHTDLTARWTAKTMLPSGLPLGASCPAAQNSTTRTGKSHRYRPKVSGHCMAMPTTQCTHQRVMSRKKQRGHMKRGAAGTGGFSSDVGGLSLGVRVGWQPLRSAVIA